MGTVGIVWIRLRMSRATFTKPYERAKDNIQDKHKDGGGEKNCCDSSEGGTKLPSTFMTHLFASNLAVLNDSRCRGVNSQHGVVVVWIMLRIRLICCHDGYGRR